MPARDQDSDQASAKPPQILTRDDSVRIAYHKLEGRSPGIVFLAGFMSDMEGTKATLLEEICRQDGRAFLRFDYQGHGQSSGNFDDGTIGMWAEDSLSALDALTEGPQILVGSSMGGWMMLLAARARPERIAGLVGIAAAPDFTVDLLPSSLTPEQMDEIETNGIVRIPTDYGDDPYTITKAMLESGDDNQVMNTPLDIRVPVRLLHGMEDDSVPWQLSLNLQKNLASDDVVVTIAKKGDHRLSDDDDLDRLVATVRDLAEKVGGHER